MGTKIGLRVETLEERPSREEVSGREGERGTVRGLWGGGAHPQDIKQAERGGEGRPL